MELSRTRVDPIRGESVLRDKAVRRWPCGPMRAVVDEGALRERSAHLSEVLLAHLSKLLGRSPVDETDRQRGRRRGPSLRSEPGPAVCH
jgi:hypothetical protein